MSRLIASAVLVALLALPAAAQSDGLASTAVACVDGFAGSFPCGSTDLLARLTHAEMGGGTTEGNDIWGWTDPTTGREYAIVGQRNGTAFVDVTDGSAVPLGRLATATFSSTWRDIKTVGNYAVIVSEARDHGMQIFDLTRLRGLTENATRPFTSDATYSGFGSAHNIVWGEGTPFVYAVGSRPAEGLGLPTTCGHRGFHAVDLTNPLAPTFAGCFSDRAGNDTGYTHDAQCLIYDGPDASRTGREICFGSNENEVTIFDVTNKSAVQVLSRVTYPGRSYTHQGWLTDDRAFLLVNDELDESNNTTAAGTQRTLIFDVSDLSNPEFAFAYDSGLFTIDHNLYVRGRYAFASNYESGLRVLDLGNISSGVVTEAAYFDTFPQRTSVNFDGTWSNYPYFQSGNVIVNDITNGLFVVQLAGLIVDSEPSALPGTGARLSAVSPNPATQVARATLTVDTPQAVTADLVDLTGRVIARVFDGPAAPDRPVVLTADVSALPAGAYILRVIGADVDLTQRVVVVR